MKKMQQQLRKRSPFHQVTHTHFARFKCLARTQTPHGCSEVVQNTEQIYCLSRFAIVTFVVCTVKDKDIDFRRREVAAREERPPNLNSSTRKLPYHPTPQKGNTHHHNHHRLSEVSLITVQLCDWMDLRTSPQSKPDILSLRREEI